MWVDQAGVAHTVAMPDPTWLMSDEFLDSLDAMAGLARTAVQNVIDDAALRVYETDLSGLGESATHVALTPPQGLLHGHGVTADDVALAIDRVELRWRLDAITALDEYLD